jgi:hypothetical protein
MPFSTRARDEVARRAACEYGPLATRHKRIAAACRCVGCAPWSDRRLRALIDAGRAYADRAAPLSAITDALPEAETAASEIARRANADAWNVFDVLRAGGATVDARAARTAIAAVRWALGTGGTFPPIPAGWTWMREALAESRTAPVCDSAWLTSDVLALARLAQAGELDVLPILADALQDAGCYDERILVHCRADCPHTHTCWVPDLLLDAE